MKINKLLQAINESDESKTVRNAPAPGKMGDLITSAQAAKILGVEMSRVRQLVASGDLKSYQPEDGRRDHFFKKAEIETYKSKDKDKGGRPKNTEEKDINDDS